jgi:ATP-dependent helicase IRC3
MTAFQLRDYQQEAIQAVLTAEDRGLQRIVIVLPTGAGKTVIFSSLLSILPRKALVLAHRSELLDQARDKIARTLGARRVVALEQGPNRAPADADIVVASIRSLHTERLKELLARHQFGLVIYDECHHAPADDNTRVLRQLGTFDPDWGGLLVGFTATTGRGDRRGLDEVFQEISYHRGLPAMIREGYLVPLKGFRVATEADLRAISPVGDADFGIEELEAAIDIRGRNALVARTIQELCRDRKTLVFCVTVQHARNLARALNDVGVSTGMVHGEMPADERAAVLHDFHTGHYAAITNVGVLTEGFDEPSVSCVAMARPTRSDSLYTQCVGRGTRLHPGKADCLVLDFVDVSELSLVTLPSLFGMPPQLDLDGEDVLLAEERLGQMFEDFPTFELPPDTITLSEIEERAQQFDPLTLDIDPSVAAISGYAWTSLGRAGLVLHYLRGPEKLGEYLVLDSRTPGKKRYQVFANQRPVATFSRVEDAVEAVDYEVNALGPAADASAQPHATWRRLPPSAAQQQALAALRPPGRAQNKEEAVRHLAFAKYARKKGR